MDIPDFEELQWLESQSVSVEDYELQTDPSPPASPEHDENTKLLPTLALPPRPSTSSKLSTDVDSTFKKRTRFGHPEWFELDPDRSDGKRYKTVAEEDLNEESDANDEESALEIPLNENVVLGDGEESGDMLIVEKEERILSRFATEIDGDCVPITGLDGEMVFAKICRYAEDDQEKRKKPEVGEEFWLDAGLLAEPVRVLMQKVEHSVFTKAVQESVEGPTEVVAAKTFVDDEKLWVEKFSPKSFTELLSDEKTNREVLLWLKQWDLCVFGSEIKSTSENVFSALSRHSSGSMLLKRSGKWSNSMNNRETRFTGDSVRVHRDLDKENNLTVGTAELDNRTKMSSPPERKILLLCGPPGLGKTTLAHVAAKHCGYHVVEINASDDRSTSTIETKILDVLQMNSVVAGSKPKCLVIDEIDGALGDGKGAVEVILRLVSADTKSYAGKDNLDNLSKSGKKASRKKQRTSQLLRPIICICNDLYAPALRPLREVAKVHIFVQPGVSRVVNRLKYICNKEGVKTSSIALSALANYT
ncbi:chromosome transmission fidelity protein 18, partial [Genlisea aurea]